MMMSFGVKFLANKMGRDCNLATLGKQWTRLSGGNLIPAEHSDRTRSRAHIHNITIEEAAPFPKPQKFY